MITVRHFVAYSLVLLTSAGCGTTSVAASGHAFVLRGEITPTILENFRNNVDSVDTLFVTSQGGDIISSIEMGKIVKAKNLKVIVSRYCLSACAQFILPAAREIYINRYSIVALHSSPIAIERELRQAGLTGAIYNGIPMAERERSFYRHIGVDEDFVANLLPSLRPICIRYRQTTKQEFSRIAVKYQLFVPTRLEFETWIGRSVSGFWPTNLSDVIDSARRSFPPSVQTSLTMSKINMEESRLALPMCEK